MKLWLHSKSDRDAVVCVLFDNGYVIRRIERPNEKYPLTMVDYGIEIMDAPDKSSRYEILDIPDIGDEVYVSNISELDATLNPNPRVLLDYYEKAKNPYLCVCKEEHDKDGFSAELWRYVVRVDVAKRSSLNTDNNIDRVE
jgi:hypothetical protein